MPAAPVDAQRLNSQVEHKDIAHPITQSFRDYLQKRVLEAYEKEKSNKTSGSLEGF
jgi:DNA-binding cell septation regulator SpoVG